MAFEYAPGREKWDPQPHEVAAAHAAFTRFRLAPPASRAVETIARDLKIPIDRVRRWASRYRWRERAGEWDAFVAKTAREKEIEAIQRTRERQLNLARVLQDVGERVLSDVSRQKKIDPKTVPIRDAVKMVVDGVKLERLVVGESTANVSQKLSLAEAAVELERLKAEGD